MRKLLTLISLFFLSLLNIVAQSWTMQHPYPTYNHLGSVSFPSLEIGYVGAENGTLLKTTNGGSTWTRLSLPEYLSGTNFWNLTFLNNDTGFYASGPHVFRTVNGGESWEPKRLNLYAWEAATDVFFLNNLVGYASGYYSTLHKTSDGGDTWTQLINNTNDYNELTFLKFANEQTGYLIDYLIFTREYILKRTDDGGQTWNTIQVPDEVGRIAALEVVGPNDVWIGSSYAFQNDDYWTHAEARVYHSTDGGTTWSVHPVGMANSFDYAIDNITFFNELQGRVVSYSHIYETNDGGLTWIDHYNSWIDASTYCHSHVCWLNPETCYVAGYMPSLVKTTDTGSNMEELFQNSGYTYWCVHFSDSLKGFAGSRDRNNYMAIRYTEDGGITWTDAACDSVYEAVTDFHFYNENNAIAVFTGGLIRTSDGGYTWTADTSQHTFIFPKIEVTPDGTLLVAGLSGKVSRSDDNGTSWTEIFSGVGGLNVECFKFTDNLTGYMQVTNSYFANTGIIYKTTDGGYTWSPYDFGSTSFVECFDFYDSQHGMICLTDKTLLYTHDGGQTWIPSSITFSHAPTYIKMFNSTDAVVSGSGYYVATTINGGVSFTVDYQGTCDWALIEKSTCFINPDHGWSVGEQGMIQKYDAHTTGLKGPGLPVVTSSFIYPNPADEKIHIMDANGMLMISNLSGNQCLKTRVKAGDQINISHLPVGIYIATVVNDKEIKSCKLVKQ